MNKVKAFVNFESGNTLEVAINKWAKSKAIAILNTSLSTVIIDGNINYSALVIYEELALHG